MAWTTPGTATAGSVLTAAFWNTQVRDNMDAVARGVVAFASTGTQTSVSTTLADITNMSVTWTAKAGQNYLVIANVSGTIKQTNAGDMLYQLTDGSNNVKDRAYEALGVNGTWSKAIMWEFIRNASAGSTTRKVRQLSSSAGGVFNRSDVSDNLGTIIAVIDLGNTSI